MNNADLPAYPIVIPTQYEDTEVFHGLTKREYMATHILAGLAANHDVIVDLGDDEGFADAISRVAIDIADHFIEELNEEATP